MQRNAHSLIARLRWALLALLLVVPSAYGWERDDRLAIMAADLLPAILAAQEPFVEYYFPPSVTPAAAQPLVPALTVHVVYRKKRYLAERTVKRINALKPVKGVPLKARAVSLNTFIAERAGPSVDDAALGKSPNEFVASRAAPQVTFIIEDMGKQLQRVLTHAHQDLTYSSSIDDVEAGVAVGLSVTERVLPAVNTSVLSKMQIQFSSLFMRIAKRVE